MRAGDLFLFSGIAEKHAWTIITDPKLDAINVLIVNWTSWTPELDQACIIERGEHPYIQGKTVVNFARAKVVTDQQLELLRAKNRLTLLDPLGVQLLTKIQLATQASTGLKLDFAELLVTQGLVQ